MNRADASPAYRWPSGIQLPSAKPGFVILDGPVTLWDAREAFYDHPDLWNALRDDYWAALLELSDQSNLLGA
ncbi:hypothetical protein [Nocardia colli]|uniref:hypothetical protein n=1 Tax=Nocardia colli TaxID=2545717 RepID=UPI0035D58DC9